MSEKQESEIAAKLRALGVNLGSQGMKQPDRTRSADLDEALAGRSLDTPQGETFLVEKVYPLGAAHGKSTLQLDSSLEGLAEWVGNSHVNDLDPSALAFIDTETTGLSGGTGTYAFLIGAGRIDGDEFRLAQFFMRDPVEEPAQLIAFEEFIAPCEALVSFNGKAFDVPLLVSRFVTHGWRSPLQDYIHIDLLHLARRLWRLRLPSRTLPNLENQILGALRSQEDIPGWMIPSIYFDFLRDGDAQPLTRVFYHNAMDVLSLAVLLNHMAATLINPIEMASQYSTDLIALGRHFENLGNLKIATHLYLQGLEHEDAKENRLPEPILLDALLRLALIYKRQGELNSAIDLWQHASSYGQLHAHVELAKCFEHQFKQIDQALYWTQNAIGLLENIGVSDQVYPHLNTYTRQQWLNDLHHRLHRLQVKQSRSQ